MSPRKRVRLAYGRDGLDVLVPADATVLVPRHLPALEDEQAAIRTALREPMAGPPLAALVPAGARVGISVCDITRPFPFQRVLAVLLEELAAAGAGPTTLYVATGTHRFCTHEELVEMLGAAVLARGAVVQHDAFDRSSHADLGPIPGSDARALVDGRFLDEEVRITTGFVEPHFFAGFSGGPKMIAPGLASIETVLELHSAARIGDPRATWGVTQGNPVHDVVRAVAARARVTFNLDVTLNRERGITRVFAGSLLASHAAASEHAKGTAMVATDAPFDVVVTSNSGYPLDQNLYQSVKGMSAAAQIVRVGGTIILAAACADGLPEHGRYKDLLREADGPEAYLARLEQPGFSAHDQWQVQVQALIQRRARVLVKADGLRPTQVRDAWLEPTEDVSGAVEELVRGGARVAVLPEGPQTIPYIADR